MQERHRRRFTRTARLFPILFLSFSLSFSCPFRSSNNSSHNTCNSSNSKNNNDDYWYPSAGDWAGHAARHDINFPNEISCSRPDAGQPTWQPASRPDLNHRWKRNPRLQPQKVGKLVSLMEFTWCYVCLNWFSGVLVGVAASDFMGNSSQASEPDLPF